MSEEHEPRKMKRKAYEQELARLEVELVRLQEWIKAKGLRVAVVFEGRDSAGKGGIIKRITWRLNPRVVRVAALPAPTEREKTQYYLQRYIPYLPAAGEMVLFDRSWYNRLGVERVMGFCTDDQYERFLEICPVFEESLVQDGIILIKYWLHIRDDVQEQRFRQRATDPRRQWKLSPMDVASWNKWIDYSRARDVMLTHTDTDVAPWYIVDANIKRNARLNVIRHLLGQFDYETLEHEIIEFPPRPPVGDYVAPPIDDLRIIPDHYG
ncbi:polyphosphate kinase 2 [Mycolicibacterium palauense]|uniref:polyphosphate kinase 2 n=1 Tax=Mycolicibacterium palauense TaxID=2034511 RepID=UPI000BFECC09|nr:polyphosphate kinase 2 [Mycolicibacterium palauense]